ncbi:MAG: ATP-dependent RNA helicase RhlE [Bacteroidia bacterium]|jgi:ATP-dependent RNA helicase RhlE
MSFKSLGLSKPLLEALRLQGYQNPTTIQEKSIPAVFEGGDLLASAQTGTGKTAGFTLPLLQILSESPTRKRRAIKVLILTPTRELAAQILANLEQYGRFLDIRSTVVFGGVSANPQITKLRQGIDILVATPGRLLDLESQRKLSLHEVEHLVLDEADRMLDMGFLRDIKRILKLLPAERQNLLFSATFSKEIKELAGSFLHNPKLVEATPENTTVEKIEQSVYRVDKKKKPQLIMQLIKDGKWQQVLVFTRTKHGANKLAEKMNKNGISAVAIHGNKSQNARTKALADFKKGGVRVLVATDIAARGLDIPLLPHVVNYEIPNVPEDYVHRIGRTGRAGESGEAVSLVSIEEVPLLKDIVKLIGITPKNKTLEGYEPTDIVPPKQAAPANKHRQPRNNNRNNSAKPKSSYGNRSRRR